MASKEEDNKLECNSIVNKDQERNFVYVYKKYDYILNSKTESFEKKIKSIIDVWHSIGEKTLSDADVRYVTQIMDWAKLHALNIVLTAEWKDFKAQYEQDLLKEIETVQQELSKINTAFATRCQKLADVVKNPWEGPILVKLLSQRDAEIGPDEIEFFCVETAYLVSYRLKKLCESQCEDLALNLVTAFMKCRALSKTQNFNLNANETQMWFIFDIYIALLYKFQENQKIVSLLKELTLEEGLQLIKRFAKKQVKISKIWKHCQKIAVLACQVFVSTAAVKFSEEHRSILESLVECFITICNSDQLIQNFTTSLRRISQLADASGLYVFCDVVHRKAGIKLKPFTLEMYIRALTADMNNLERQKNDSETQKLGETTKRLASAFCKLADLLDEHVKVTRECVLTAFSLEPTEDRLKKIIDLAKRSGFQVLDTGQEWKCKLHPPLLNKDEVAWICNSCGDWMCKPQLSIPLNTNIALNEALQADDLGISPQLCDDLAVCLSNPRYQVLSWLLPWEDLHRICVMYTNDPERTKNVVTELKFVDIDYSMFKNIKREPIDELAGIERGYEQYLDHDFTSDDQMSTISEDSASQDSRPYSLGSDGAGEMPYLPFLNQPKSDPNTLKSLRMFRPNLKRSKPIEPGQSVPEKLYKLGVTDIPPKPQTSVSSFNQKCYNTSPMLSRTHNPQLLNYQYSLPGYSKQSQQNLKTLPDPKNGLVATLPLHGGQVATNHQTNQTTFNLTQVNPITSAMVHPPQTITPVMQMQRPQLVLKENPLLRPILQQTKDLLRIRLQKKYFSSGMPESSKNEFKKCIISNIVPPPLHPLATTASNSITTCSSTNITTISSNSNITSSSNSKFVSTSTTINKHPNNKLPQQTTNTISNNCNNIFKTSNTVYNNNSSKQPSPDLLTDVRNPLPQRHQRQEKQSKDQQQQPHQEKLSQQHQVQKKEKLRQLPQSVKSLFSFSNTTPVTKPKPPSKITLDLKNPVDESIQSLCNKDGITVQELINTTIGVSFREKTECDKFPLAHKNLEESPEVHKSSEKNNEVQTIFKGIPEEQKSCVKNTEKPKIFKEIPLGHKSFKPSPEVHESPDKIPAVQKFPEQMLVIFKNSDTILEEQKSSEKGSEVQKIADNDPEVHKSPEIKTEVRDTSEKSPKVHNSPEVSVAEKSPVVTNEAKTDTRDTTNCISNNYKNILKEFYINCEILPKTIYMTENIRTYAKKKPSKNNGEKKDCVKTPKEGDQNLFNVCKNVNSCNGNCVWNHNSNIHSSNVQTESYKLRELKVVLNRIPSGNKPNTNCTINNKIERTSCQNPCNKLVDNKLKCDKLSAPQKSSRRRKSNDKSENNINEQAPKRVQNYKLSPLQDINPRVPSLDKEKEDSTISKDCDPKKFRSEKDLHIRLERLPMTKNAKAVLANVPGLNDYQMIRPANVNHIVNVVQISGGRPTSNVVPQNTQTSTQVTPHIQRIGQPRTDKPEQTNTETSTVTTSSNSSTVTTTTGKPATSQPSTLLNILSQQIIRPGQSNCVRTRPSPLINILSQQEIRPANPQLVQKIVSSNAVITTETPVNNVSKVTTTTAETVTVNAVKNVATVKNVVTTPATGQGTILQFICKSSSLPKFQQAFGKSVYTNNVSKASESTTTNVESTNADPNKKQPVTKNIPVNVQPIQGSVIYTRQMPVGQAINLIPPGRGQVFRIATSNAEQISLVKDTVIHSKMSALLAAALQGKKTTESQVDGEETVEDGTKVTVARPTLVQNARIVKPVLQIPSNVIRTSPQSQSSNLSSTTLEQLREFDMVYKQIKERSSSTTPADMNPSSESNNEASTQRISVTYVNQGQKYTQLSPVVVVSSAYCNLQPAASPALSVTSQGSSSPCVTPAPTPTLPKVASKSSKGKTLKNSSTTHASKSSPIPKPQQKPQEDEHTTQRIFDILAEYAEQLRNSPDLNNKPAPRRRSNPPTNPSQNSKRKKSSSKASKALQCSSMVSEADTDDQRTMESEDSSCGVVQLSVPEEEPQVQAVTTTESNDSTASNSRQLILTSSDTSGNSQTRNLIIADSSVGEALKMPNTAVLVPGNYIMPVSMVKGGQQIAVVSGGSKILATVPARSGPNMLLFQSFLNQNRKAGMPTVKYSTIQPLSGISSQSLAGVSAQPPVILPPNSHSLTAVALGQPLTLKKVEDPDRVNTELLLTISQPRENIKTEVIQQPDSSTNIVIEDSKSEENISDNSSEKVFTYQKSITGPIATPVIAQAIKEEVVTDDSSTSQNIITMDIGSDNIKDEIKVERVQSVLVTACTSNGPMLSHTPPRYRKPSETCTSNNDASTKEYLHNGDKQSTTADQKHYTTNPAYYQNKSKKANPQRLDREIHQLSIQRKQAALERELRLQKSLSEECEDLGVDEPSTSDLFPEADLLFDSNHSPSFDQSSQDMMKRPQQIESKEEAKSTITLFSDDDNSSSLRTNLFEYVDEYPTADNELVFDPNQQLTNGQSSTSNESASSCEDNTLLQNCASMSDVTLNSPLSPPDLYTDTTPPSINKYKFKYSNRKKGDRSKQTESWAGEVSSSEDTTGSTEMDKAVSSPDPPCSNKRSHSISCDDELSDGSFKVVRVAISKTDLLKDDESCEELHCDDDLDCSPSGRGARRSVKKMCSCCNGSQDGGGSRKRPNSRPHTPSPHKKAFVHKKR